MPEPRPCSTPRNQKTLLIACGLAVLTANLTQACPFCTAVGPTLSQQSDRAQVVALGEVLNETPTNIQAHRIVKGKLAQDTPIALPDEKQLKPGTLVICLGEKSPDAETLEWSAIPVNETSIGYYVKSPSTREPESDRLAYFAPFLEHADPLIAEDAYREFGRAALSSVEQAATKVSGEQLRLWLASDRVPPARKGLYGLMLGLVKDSTERSRNAKFLREQMTSTSDDFRAGFDGLLGGYLLLNGQAALADVETKFLANPSAAVGDVRHAMTALRFYHEHGREISSEQISAAMARVLDRPAFAAAAITDLARWQAWKYCDTIAAIYGDPKFADPVIRRAVIGYLLASPDKQAAAKLNQLRTADPEGVKAAEIVLRQLGDAQ